MITLKSGICSTDNCISHAKLLGKRARFRVCVFHITLHVHNTKNHLIIYVQRQCLNIDQNNSIIILPCHYLWPTINEPSWGRIFVQISSCSVFVLVLTSSWSYLFLFLSVLDWCSFSSHSRARNKRRWI